MKSRKRDQSRMDCHSRFRRCIARTGCRTVPPASGSTGPTQADRQRRSRKSWREVQEHLTGHEVKDPHAPPVLDAVHAELEAELGDLLFACVNLCRKAGVHASLALDKANEKFEERFGPWKNLPPSAGIEVRVSGTGGAGWFLG